MTASVSSSAIAVNSARSQRGVTMLEVLVTLFIVTLFLLTTAGVQSSALKLNKAAQMRTTAVLYATDIAERMEANIAQAATGTAYAADCASPPTSACSGGACSPSQRAADDLAQWCSLVLSLPGGSGTIVWSTATTPPAYTIRIGWTDRRANTAYGADSATTFSAGSESFSYTMTRAIFGNPS